MQKKITKKYALADFYEEKFGELITASDDINEIKKSAKQYRKDTDDECMLIGLQWSDELDSYTPIMNF